MYYVKPCFYKIIKNSTKNTNNYKLSLTGGSSMSSNLYQIHDQYSSSMRSNIDINLVYCGFSKDENDWINHYHSHDFIEIFYIVSGQGKFVINEKEYVIQAGCIIIIPSNVMHREYSLETDSLEYVFVAVKSMKTIVLSNGINLEEFCKTFSPTINTYKYKNKIQEYFTDIISEVMNKVNGYELMYQSLILQLLVMIKRIIESDDMNNQIMDTKETEMVRKYIERNYSEHITLDDLANACFTSKYYMSHIFKKDLGVSPIKYLIIKRIEESKVLLRTTDLTIAEVSEKVGYENITYFIQTFKKVVGKSPKEFRQV